MAKLSENELAVIALILDFFFFILQLPRRRKA
ncbi:unnamed protein product [Acanthoscelides obtectus]|uniref:Uncharacterized protein n=1 Tax=Acanthoscelides obtectus TaxID=200917 RepID=A0A9P0PBE1_ACAOB|nr:unnamed protein product [Acanthoscelides obtectus]CAK1628619.1 hypothetical protein AOBTE_LOCUS5311 [Acanthoscelides obtectus]